LSTDRTALILVAALVLAPAALAGQATPPAKPLPTTQVAAPPTDPVLITAETLIGKALFLRNFYASNSLSYNAAGQLEGDSKASDWTLAAVNVLKATRPTPDEIELEGVRTAVRYNPDAHEFQRHALNDQKMKLVIQLDPNPGLQASQLRVAFAAIFAVGIDPALQRSMPPLWRHYFDPGLVWPADGLTTATIYQMLGQADQPKDVTPPSVASKVEPGFTAAARVDKVRGPLQLRLVVDAEGVPQRIVVTRPLGYGLDERAAEALAKWRYNPAIRGGQPVPVAILINFNFDTPPPQKP
jgi:TonB family protein